MGCSLLKHAWLLLLQGGGVYVFSGEVSFTSCSIYGNEALSGGGVVVEGGTVSFETCTISGNTASWWGGGVYVVSGNVAFTQTTINGNSASGLHGYVFTVNTGRHLTASGGGLYVSGGHLTLTTTLIHSNTAPNGANVLPAGGLLFYQLPTPPGYWLPNADCVANRDPCETWNTACNNYACSTTAGDAANGWTPGPCKPPIFIQPCEWQTPECASGAASCPLGKKLYFTPFFPIDATFPNPCAAGYLGSDESAYQTSSNCAGQCPAGTYCPNDSTVEALICPAGSYCPAGSVSPRLCEGGTYGNATGLASARECTPVAFGEWAPTGAALPERCFTGFHCPGRVHDRVNLPPGSKPILVSDGSAIVEEVIEVVTQELVFEGDVDDYDEAVVRSRLAAQSGIPLELIALSSRAGSVILTVTLSSVAEPNVTMAVDALLSRISHVDYATVGHSVGASLVSVSAPRKENQTRVAQSTCPLGHWCTAGLEVKCEFGYYNPTLNANNQGACRRCPDHAVTLTEASVAVAACLCEVEHYDADPGLNVSCVLCPSGTACTSVGRTTATVPIRPGYYRLSNDSMDVRRCPDASSGCGGKLECGNQTTSGCKGTANGGPSPCREGLDGVFCRKCASREDGASLYYSPATDASNAECRECGTMGSGTVAAAAIAVGVVLVALLLVWLYRYRLPASSKRKVIAAWQQLAPLVKLKILIGSYQIITKIGPVYEVDLPYDVRRLLDRFAWAVSFGLSGVGMPLDCLGWSGYGNQLAVFMVVPFVVAALIVLGAAGWHAGRTDKYAQAVFKSAMPLIMWLLFLAYPLVTTVAFEAFPCFPLDDTEWLKADVSIQCGTPEHARATTLAWAGILLYPVGLLLGTASLLVCARQAILNREPTALSQSIAFQWREYKPQFYWFELVEMMRRFLLVGLMVVVYSGTVLQVLLGTFFASVFLLVQVWSAPYRLPSNNYLATASSFCQATFFLASVAFKYVSLTDLDDVQDRMNDEQKDAYVYSTAILTAILVASTLATLCLSLLLFLYTATATGMQMVWDKEALLRRTLRLALKQLSDADADRRDLLIAGLEMMDRPGGSLTAAADHVLGGNGLHPKWWGVSKEQLVDFRKEVVAAIKANKIVNYTPLGLTPYSQEKFDDPAIGPNMHQVNHGLIKPLTLHGGTDDEPPPLPGLSYALMRNYGTGGLPCHLFISHAWDEGVFELIDNALKAWPDGCQGAYICCLSNPQNLDISEVLAHQDGSPFERILKSGVVTNFQMLANNNTPIHSRLWCVLEAHVARGQDSIHQLCISGKPTQLLTGELGTMLRKEDEAAQARRAAEEQSVKAELQQRLQNPELLGGPQQEFLNRVDQQLQQFQKAAEAVAQAKLAVLKAADSQLVSLSDARCTVESDAEMIRQKIAGDEEAITKMVVGLIRDVVCGANELAADTRVCPGSLALPLVDEHVDLRQTSFEGKPLLLLQFACWLRLRPKVRVLQVAANDLAHEGVEMLHGALKEGLLLEVSEVCVEGNAVMSQNMTALAKSVAEEYASKAEEPARTAAEVTNDLGAGTKSGGGVVFSARPWSQRLAVCRSKKAKETAVTSQVQTTSTTSAQVELVIASGAQDSNTSLANDPRVGQEEWLQRQLGAGQTHATFGHGTIGLTVAQVGERVQVSRVDAGSQASEQGVVVGSTILEVAGRSVAGLDKAAVLEAVKQAERPVTVLLDSPS